MNILIHLCKKDFVYTKPWFIGVWLTLVLATVLPWFSPIGETALPFMMIVKFAPAVLIFLTSTRIIHCDPFVGTSEFMRTRPVRATTLLRNKLILIALLLVLPAVGFALLNAACLLVRLSPSDYLLLFVENCLYFLLIAGAAVAYSVISRNGGIMVAFIVISFLLLMLLNMFHQNSSSRPILEDQHLNASLQLVAQIFLSVAAVAIAMNWAGKRLIWLTAASLFLCVAFLVALGRSWKWNFVDALSKDTTTAEMVSGKAALTWLGEPKLISNLSRNHIRYSQLTRSGRISGLKNGWMEELVKFQSEARFADGTLWPSMGTSGFNPFDMLPPQLLSQIGIELPENHRSPSYQKTKTWTLFEGETSHFEKLSNRRASIRGTGDFLLYQPYILDDMPATAGASVVSGRFRYRLDSVSAFGKEISYKISIRGVALTSRGDNDRDYGSVRFLFANPTTGKFTDTQSSGGSSRVGSDWINIHGSVSLDQQQGTPSNEETQAFLKDARLYILGTRYGGTISLPSEVPEMLLEEKR